MVDAVMFSSKSTEWETPQKIFDELNKEFNFTIDVCATKENAKCKKYITKEENALAGHWDGICWMNPPYGREIGKWIKHAWESSIHPHLKTTVVCLIPARTDTKWWHEYIDKKAEIRFIKGRLKFGGHKNSAPFPSVVVIFRGQKIC